MTTIYVRNKSFTPPTSKKYDFSDETEGGKKLSFAGKVIWILFGISVLMFGCGMCSFLGMLPSLPF